MSILALSAPVAPVNPEEGRGADDPLEVEDGDSTGVVGLDVVDPGAKKRPDSGVALTGREREGRRGRWPGR
jgi:hypothetical protein